MNINTRHTIIAFTTTILLAPLAAIHAADKAGKTQAAIEQINVPIADGPCQPNWKSLGDQFKCPSWWRKAKIGMWLHWGPQSVGQDGDWYAKWIYMPQHAWGARSVSAP